MNSIGLYNSLVNTSYPPSSSGDNNVEKKENVSSTKDVSKDKVSAPDAGEQLKLSSRSQKLQAISQEFFVNKDLTKVDTKALIEKVHEYGLISNDEYKTLKSDALFKDLKSKEKEEPKSLIEHLRNLKKAVDKTDKDSGTTADNTASLSKGLAHAITILSDVEKAKGKPTLKKDIGNAQSELKKLSQSESFSKLSDEYQQAIKSSRVALEVIDKISPQRLSNPFVNRYLDFAS